MLFAYGCKKDHLIETELVNKSDQSHQVQLRGLSADYDYFSVALAVAQADKSVRDFLKDALTNNPWDDNSVLYAAIKDSIIKGTNTFAEILYDSRDTTRGGFSEDFFDEDVLLSDPGISIFLYPGDDDYDIGDWDTNHSTGVITFPDDLWSIDSLSVYNDDLSTYNIDLITEPRLPYLSVGGSSVLGIVNLDDSLMFGGYSVAERIEGRSPSSITLCEEFWEALNDGVEEGYKLTVDGINFLLIPEDILILLYCDACDPDYDGCDSGNGHGDGDDDEDCEDPDRDQRHEREELVKYTFSERNTLNRTCHWLRRICRFQINAVFASNPMMPSIGTLAKYDRTRRKNLKGWKGNWAQVDPSLYFLKWEQDQFADPMKYVWHWLHPSPQIKEEYTVGFNGGFDGGPDASGSVKITIEHKDKLLGEDAVYYCDDANGVGTEYYTGKVKFYAKEYEPE